VASGTQPVPFTDVNIPADLSAKVFYEVFPICTVASKTVAIVGAGDAAFDYALNLARNNDVLILNRTDRIKALPLLVERATACSRIRYQENARLTSLKSGPNGRLSLVWASAGAEHKTDVDYLIFAVGRQPLLDFLAAGVDSTASENDNLYFCGDVKNARFRQTAIAAGDGIRAAMSIYGKLKERSG
jgi:thioredoxin reductase